MQCLLKDLLQLRGANVFLASNHSILLPQQIRCVPENVSGSIRLFLDRGILGEYNKTHQSELATSTGEFVRRSACLL